ncbi:hypothetical protein MKW92_030168 [Papaver armeniacum]|nr:hypothetical protein MKW92_030168 [Papaver armeniacum]
MVRLRSLSTKSHGLSFRKEIDFEVETIRLELGEHKRPMPVVEDGDFRLFESRAIIRYYAAKYADQGTNLLGKTLEELALVDQWLEVEAHNFNELIYTIVFQVVILPRMGQTTDSELVGISEEKLEKSSRYIRRTIVQKTVILLGRLIRPRRRGKGYLVKDGKNVNAWWEDISNRPAWKKVLKLMEKN